MSATRYRFLLFVPLMLLACNTLMAPLRSRIGIMATETPPLAATSAALPTRAPATAGVDEGDLELAGGLVFGSPEAAAAALAASTPTLESLASEQYEPETLSQPGRSYTYTIALARSLSLLWINGWCTTTEEILEQNFEHITIEFFANGTAIDLDQFAVLDVVDASGLICRGYYTVVKSWPAGQTEVTSRWTFAEQINDGMADYPAGTHEYIYTVTVR